MGADIAIILSDDSTIQMAELVVHDSVVSELSHRKQGWVRIMKPKKMREDGSEKTTEKKKKTSHDFKCLGYNQRNVEFLVYSAWRKL